MLKPRFSAFARRRRLLAVVSLAAGAPFLAACGDDEKGAKAASATIEVTGGEKGPVRYTVPDSIPGGLVKLELKNSGKSSHEAQLVRIEGDHTIQEAFKLFEKDGGPTPAWIRGAGGVGATDPGASRSATQQLSGAGKYYVFDTQSGDNGPEGYKRGGFAEVKVEGKGEGGDLPSAPATITAKEYSFAPSGLKAGPNTVEFDNTGKELHHVIALPERKGATLGDVKKFVESQGRPSGPPPVDFEKVQSTAVLDGGTKQVTELTLEKGKYALLCFISDRKGGPPHVAKGMLAETTVR